MALLLCYYFLFLRHIDVISEKSLQSTKNMHQVKETSQILYDLVELGQQRFILLDNRKHRKQRAVPLFLVLSIGIIN